MASTLTLVNGLMCSVIWCSTSANHLFGAECEDDVQKVRLMSCCIRNTGGLLNDLCDFVGNGEVSVVATSFSDFAAVLINIF